MIVLRFGLGPVSLGSVLMLETAFAFSGGNRLLTLNLINGFLMGKRPKDSSCLRPKTLISMLNMLVFM